MLRQHSQHERKVFDLFRCGSDSESPAILLNHGDAGAAIGRVKHQVHRTFIAQNRTQRAQTRLGIYEMMEHACRHYEIEAVVQVGGILDRQLPNFEVRQLVLLLECLGVPQTGRTDIDGDDTGSRMTERKLCSLPRSTSGNENVKVGAIFPVGPEQMIFGAMNILVLPHVTSAFEIFEIFQRRWVWMIRVKLAYGVCDSFRFHEFCLRFQSSGARVYTKSVTTDYTDLKIGFLIRVIRG